MSSQSINEQPLQAGTDLNVGSPQKAAEAKTAQQGEVTGATKFKSLADLRRKSPKLYNMMMQGIAMSICKAMERGQDRIKAAMRKAREDFRQG